MFFLLMLDTPEEERRFEQIYREYERRVFGLALQYARDFHYAEEITQSVFFKIAENIKIIPQNPFKLKSYIYTVAKNTALNHLINLTRRPAVTYLADDGVASPTLEDVIVEKEKSEKIANCIESLPEMYRDIMILFYVCELKIKEISASLDLNEATVKNRLVRGKKILRRKIKEIGLDE